MGSSSEFPVVVPQAVHQLIEREASHNQNKPALVYKGDVLTYDLLNKQANQWAHFLIELGVGPETIVGVSVKRSFDMVIAILAIWKAGGAYVPIDPDYPTHRIEYIVADSKIELLLSEQNFLEHLPFVNRKICMDSERKRVASYPTANLSCVQNANHLAYLLYTSGSTGNPKGVMVSHGNLIATYLSWEKIYQLTAQDVHLQMAGFSFDVFAGDLLRALCSGAKLVLCPKGSLLSPPKLYHLMVEHQINCAEFMPTVIRRLLDYLKSHGETLSFMRLLLCGSDSWFLNEYRALKQFCGSETRVINSYGLTEASIDSTWFEDNAESLKSIVDNQYVPIGKPFPHVTIFLLNEGLNRVPSGNIGEIYIGGEGVARGYYNRPELDNERFIWHSFEGAAPVKLYRTGDKARLLPDGNIQFLGRTDNQIKLRGIRIELTEIECMINSYPTIKESVVVLNEQEPSHPRLVSYVVFEIGAEKCVAALHHFLVDNLPAQLVPALFVPLEELPLTPNGKVDRTKLKKKVVVFHQLN